MPQKSDKKPPLWYWPANLVIGALLGHIWKLKLVAQGENFTVYGGIALLAGVAWTLAAFKWGGRNYGPLALTAFATGIAIFLW